MEVDGRLVWNLRQNLFLLGDPPYFLPWKQRWFWLEVFEIIYLPASAGIQAGILAVIPVALIILLSSGINRRIADWLIFKIDPARLLYASLRIPRALDLAT